MHDAAARSARERRSCSTDGRTIIVACTRTAATACQRRCTDDHGQDRTWEQGAARGDLAREERTLFASTRPPQRDRHAEKRGVDAATGAAGNPTPVGGSTPSAASKRPQAGRARPASAPRAAHRHSERLNQPHRHGHRARTRRRRRRRAPRRSVLGRRESERASPPHRASGSGSCRCSRFSVLFFPRHPESIFDRSSVERVTCSTRAR